MLTKLCHEKCQKNNESPFIGDENDCFCQWIKVLNEQIFPSHLPIFPLSRETLFTREKVTKNAKCHFFMDGWNRNYEIKKSNNNYEKCERRIKMNIKKYDNNGSRFNIYEKNNGQSNDRIWYALLAGTTKPYFLWDFFCLRFVRFVAFVVCCER